MVFLCPTCNVQSSGRGGRDKPKILKKSGRGWRERAKQRSIMPTQSELGYTCPCCKEMRSLEQYNPFKSKIASLFKSYTSKDVVKVKSTKVVPFTKRSTLGPERTTKSVEYLAVVAGFSLDSLANSNFRTYEGTFASVSWDDAIEMRRYAMKMILLKLANASATKIQTMARIARAKARAKRIREQKYTYSSNHSASGKHKGSSVL